MVSSPARQLDSSRLLPMSMASSSLIQTEELMKARRLPALA